MVRLEGGYLHSVGVAFGSWVHRDRRSAAHTAATARAGLHRREAQLRAARREREQRLRIPASPENSPKKSRIFLSLIHI